MEVAVIGRGTAAIVTSLQLIRYGHKVSIFYDPFLRPINVGESSTPIFVNLIEDVLDIKKSDLVDIGIFSDKIGINFVDWGKGNQFYHNFLLEILLHTFRQKHLTNISINFYKNVIS